MLSKLPAADRWATWLIRYAWALRRRPIVREACREVEELVGAAELAKLQMLVRVGRTSQPGLSPRRDLAAIIWG